jgi:hypothetical protein
MVYDIFALRRAAAAYAAGAPAQEAFAGCSGDDAADAVPAPLCSDAAAPPGPGLPQPADFPAAGALEALLAARTAAARENGSPPGPETPETRARSVNLLYALAAVLPGTPRLAWPREAAGPLLAQLYPDRAAREALLAVLDALSRLRETCAALPGGSFRLAEASGPILHVERRGGGEILDAVFNTGTRPHIAFLDGKAVEVHPLGFTLTVRDAGHDPNHSYYDIR